MFITSSVSIGKNCHWVCQNVNKNNLFKQLKGYSFRWIYLKNEYIFLSSTKFNDHRRSSESFKIGEYFMLIFPCNKDWFWCILQRFPNQNVSGLPREELLKLFSMYAVPKSRRTTSNDVDMKSITQSSVKRENENKRSRNQLITAPTVETVTNACKKIRLINTERTSNKRQGNSTPMVWKALHFFS